MGDAAVWGDIAAGLAGAALLVAAVPKIVAPEEIGAVLSALLSRLGAPAFRGGVAGRVVGIVEVAVGVWAVVGRGLAAAVAVAVLAAGFAVAGGLAVVSGGGLRCACFAGHARMLDGRRWWRCRCGWCWRGGSLRRPGGAAAVSLSGWWCWCCAARLRPLTLRCAGSGSGARSSCRSQVAAGRVRRWWRLCGRLPRGWLRLSLRGGWAGRITEDATHGLGSSARPKVLRQSPHTAHRGSEVVAGYTEADPRGVVSGQCAYSHWVCACAGFQHVAHHL